ncbi:MAG: ATP synthase F1 subunit gamma [Bacteroidales bacterium]|nr:ATP synthase F1 subunit gamma [Bacteroidales bacterium]
MASLKETKGRIASVKSTLKITSAMKMVASAKLHKAQNAMESMTPYERKLREMLQLLISSIMAGDHDPNLLGGGPAKADVFRGEMPAGRTGRVAIVAIASNSSLCGGFNGNVVREVKARVNALKSEGCEVEVISVGKKVAEPMKKAGYPSAEDWNELVAHMSYAGADSLAKMLQKAYADGKYSRIELVYNHFVSTATQKTVCETYLPAQPLVFGEGESREWPTDLIIEPSAEEMLADLLPLVRSLRIYTVILDSVAAEHAARTIAMQTATDNGEDILQELTLEYNKGRQQKITSEILDIVGGSMQ